LKRGRASQEGDYLYRGSDGIEDPDYLRKDCGMEKIVVIALIIWVNLGRKVAEKSVVKSSGSTGEAFGGSISCMSLLQRGVAGGGISSEEE